MRTSYCGDVSEALLGQDVTAWPQPKRARAGLGRSYQRNTIYTGFSVFENCRLAAQARHPKPWHWWQRADRCTASNDAAMAAVQKAGLFDVMQRTAGLLSHGQKRQLEIAMCLATEPQVLLLDEPLAGMGAEETDRMLQLLADLRAGHAILLVEHDMDAVFRIADRITVMVNGTVIASDAPQAVRANAAVQALRTSANTLTDTFTYTIKDGDLKGEREYVEQLNRRMSELVRRRMAQHRAGSSIGQRLAIDAHHQRRRQGAGRIGAHEFEQARRPLRARLKTVPVPLLPGDRDVPLTELAGLARQSPDLPPCFSSRRPVLTRTTLESSATSTSASEHASTRPGSDGSQPSGKASSGVRWRAMMPPPTAATVINVTRKTFRTDHWRCRFVAPDGGGVYVSDDDGRDLHRRRLLVRREFHR